MMAAHLIAGNDVAHMTRATRSILPNREVITADQDVLGRHEKRVRNAGDLEVWSKELTDGGRAVLRFNRSGRPANLTVRWRDLGVMH